MATRTFLTPTELQDAGQMLQPPIAQPNGQVQLDHSLTAALDFSSWLSLVVENRLRELPGWEEASPIAIGSWGRGELCPGSDLDVIFCGKNSAVEKVSVLSRKRALSFATEFPMIPKIGRKM